MIKIEINDKTYDYPTSWDDISMKQYCKLFHNLPKAEKEATEDVKYGTVLSNEAVIISRLLGENDGFVEALPLPMFVMLQHHTKFIYSIEDFLQSKRFYINIDGRKYFIPEVNEMSLRQYIDADMIMKEDGENQFIELLSCLLVPYGKDGKLEYDGKYQELIPKVEKMKASEGLPFIYTFFKKKQASRMVSRASSELEREADLLLHSTQGS